MFLFCFNDWFTGLDQAMELAYQLQYVRRLPVNVWEYL